jgi:putative nucleotidyltransferase with HDIG domain
VSAPDVLTNVSAPRSGPAHVAELAVGRLGQLATLPSVTLQIMRLADDPNATGDALDKLLGTDPTLGARVLRVVNSAFYGLPGTVSTTSAAIVRLGFSAIRNIAIAASLTRMFRGGHVSASFDARDIWHHSVAVAEAARLLAIRSRRVGPEEALLAGLLHDIGIVVAMQSCRTELEALIGALEAEPDESFTSLELTYLGTSHGMLGAVLSSKWGFPPVLALVAGHHHAPMALAPEHRTMPVLVCIADQLAAQSGLGYTRTVTPGPIAPEMLAHLGLSEADIAEVLAQLPEATAAATQVLGDG